MTDKPTDKPKRCWPRCQECGSPFGICPRCQRRYSHGVWEGYCLDDDCIGTKKKPEKLMCVCGKGPYLRG